MTSGVKDNNLDFPGHSPSKPQATNTLDSAFSEYDRQRQISALENNIVDDLAFRLFDYVYNVVDASEEQIFRGEIPKSEQSDGVTNRSVWVLNRIQKIVNDNQTGAVVLATPSVVMYYDPAAYAFGKCMGSGVVDTICGVSNEFAQSRIKPHTSLKLSAAASLNNSAQNSRG